VTGRRGGRELQLTGSSPDNPRPPPRGAWRTVVLPGFKAVGRFDSCPPQSDQKQENAEPAKKNKQA